MNVSSSHVFRRVAYVLTAGTVLLGGSGLLGQPLLYAQTGMAPSPSPMSLMPPAHQVGLSAQAHIEATPDWLTVVLAVQRDGPDPQAVQAQLQKALDAALTHAKTQAHASSANIGGFEVRTGAFQTHPRYGAQGRITGWIGRAELVLQGREMSRIAHTAAQLQTMVVQSLNAGLAPDTRQQLETQLQAQAIARFRQRAQHIAEAFGYKHYTIGQVEIGAIDGGQATMPTAKTLASTVAAEAAPIPNEPGTLHLQLNVSGTVLLQHASQPVGR